MREMLVAVSNRNEDLGERLFVCEEMRPREEPPSEDP